MCVCVCVCTCVYSYILSVYTSIYFFNTHCEFLHVLINNLPTILHVNILPEYARAVMKH